MTLNTRGLKKGRTNGFSFWEEQPGVKNPNKRYKEQGAGKQNYSSLIDPNTHYHGNRQENQTKEHQFCSAAQSFSARRIYCDLIVVCRSCGRSTSCEPFRQAAQREPATRTEPHLIRYLLLAAIRTIHKRSS